MILVVYRGKLIDLYDAIDPEEPEYLMTTYVTEERDLGSGETGITAFGMDLARNTMVTFKGVMTWTDKGTPGGMEGVLLTDTVLPPCKGTGTGTTNLPPPEIALTTFGS